MNSKVPSARLRALLALVAMAWLAGTGTPRAHGQAVPTITQQPQSQNVILGSNVTFTGAATGQTPFTYQWTFNGAPLSDGGRITGALSDTLTITGAQTNDAGNYAVTVFDRQGDPTGSTPAQLTVLVPPTFQIDPGGMTYPVLQGSNLTLTAVAAGSPPISAQWFFNSAPLANSPGITGATSPTLVLSTVPTSFEGQYRLVLRNVAGSATSLVATVDVLLPPLITQQPESRIVFAGSNAQFSVSVTGDSPTFRWKKDDNWLYDGGRLNGVLTTNLTIANTVESDSGNYSIFVSGTTTTQSIAATLTVRTLPVFTQQPTSKIVTTGTPLSLAAVATNTLPISVQWIFNGVPLSDGGRVSGATTTNLVITPAETNDNGAYRLIAANIVGAVNSAVANVNVGYPPTITTQPASQTLLAGGMAQLVVAADGSAPLAYRWFRNGFPKSDDARVSGTDTPALTMTNLDTGDSGNFTAEVTNLFGAATSAVAMLLVRAPPQITAQPQGRSVPSGLPTVFTASATAVEAFTRQWQFNGADIPGANGVNFTNPSVTPADAGYYRLVVSNAVGAVTSVVAQLTIGPVAQWGTASSLPPPGLSNVVSIAAGLNYSLALHADGSLTAWGINPATNIPPGLGPLVAIAAGTNHAVGLRADGTVVAWGENGFGKTNVPASLSNMVAVVAGGNYSAALRRNGLVEAWGGGTPTVIPAGLSKVASLGAGLYHLLAVKLDGTVARWGSVQTTDAPASLTNALAAAGGYQHSVALESDGTVTTWGTQATNAILTSPAPLSNVVAIAAGPNSEQRSGYTLALKSDGTVTAWGAGSVFNGASIELTNPPAGLSNVSKIAGGYVHALALINDGRPTILQSPVGGTFYTGNHLKLRATLSGAEPLSFQWYKDGTPVPGAEAATLNVSNLTLGDAGNYQLVVSNAFGSTQTVPIPAAVVDSAPQFFSQPRSRAAYFGSPWSLSATVEGSEPMSLRWAREGAPVGGNSDELFFPAGQPIHGGVYVLVASNVLGSVTSSIARIGFTKVTTWGLFRPQTNPPTDFSNAVGMAAGKSHIALLRPDRTVSVWRTNLSSLPNGPVGLTNVISLSAGNGFTVALRDNGTVAVWFTNAGPSSLTTIPATATNLAAVDANPFNVIGLRSNGTVLVWGETGTGVMPAPSGLSNVVAVSGGIFHSLALKDDGTVVGWGSTTVPVGLTNVVAIAAGYQHSLAIRTDGSVVGWSSSGQATPSSLSNVIAAASGGDYPENTGFSVALRQEGSLNAWGFNASGRTQTPAGLVSATELSAGQYFGAALLSDRSPVFTVQPWNRRVGSGAAVTFAAFAAGEAPLQYQWFKDGAPIAGETNRTLTLPAVTRGDKGWYQAHVANALGAVDSRAARLEVGGPLEWLSAESGADGASLLLGVRDSFGASLSPGDLPWLQTQASTNLLDWELIPASLGLTNGLLQLLDSDATNFPFRFYRVIEE